MNTPVISKEDILDSCRKLVSEKGLPALNMRSVAKQCNIALGSVYNYFSSKEELIMETVESVWQNIFSVRHDCKPGIAFTEYIELIFEKIKKGALTYPNFFTAHSIRFVGKTREKAREKMKNYFSLIKEEMLIILKADMKIKKNVFSPAFTEENFTDFILTNFISLLILQKNSSSVLIEIIKKIIYS
ncbi:TetR/AcrR family transcriptional regulator [Treponema sp. OMZ 840]